MGGRKSNIERKGGGGYCWQRVMMPGTVNGKWGRRGGARGWRWMTNGVEGVAHRGGDGGWW